MLSVHPQQQSVDTVKSFSHQQNPNNYQYSRLKARSTNCSYTELYCAYSSASMAAASVTQLEVGPESTYSPSKPPLLRLGGIISLWVTRERRLYTQHYSMVRCDNVMGPYALKPTQSLPQVPSLIWLDNELPL